MTAGAVFSSQFSAFRRLYHQFPKKFWIVVGVHFIDKIGATIMFPFFALAGRHNEIAAEAGARALGRDEESTLLREIGACLGTHLVLIREYWARIRRGGSGPPSRRIVH